MLDNKKVVKYVGIAISLAILALLVFKFTFVVWYVLIAAVISSVGSPIVNFLRKRKISKTKYVSPVLAAIITLVLMMVCLILIIMLFVPLFVRQVDIISSINIQNVMAYLDEPIYKVTDVLRRLKLIGQDDDLLKVIGNHLTSIVDASSVTSFISNAISSLGGFFVSTFSIIFIAFFFLKEDDLFIKIVLLFVSEENHERMITAVGHVEKFLSKYIIGLLLEILGMFVLESIGLSIIGVNGALPLALMGACLNVIPYVGPLIGTILAVIIGIASKLGGGIVDNSLIIHGILIAAVFIVSNWIDNFFLQPTIYSRSLQIHPLEIFLVILVAGSFAGILGMLIAIPAYTIIKVIAKEFFSQYEIIDEWTRNMKIE
ncbi:MAG: AI-2E family transporter [Bacteroidales bacterium]|nr:AI-2E family transporter [Bacteroidales bacterium]